MQLSDDFGLSFSFFFLYIVSANPSKVILTILSAFDTIPHAISSVVKRLSAEANRSWSQRRLIDGLFGLQQRGIVLQLWDEVGGHGPSALKQKADHKTRPIIMHCCWAPAGTMLSISPPGHSEPLDLQHLVSFVSYMSTLAAENQHFQSSRCKISFCL